MPRQLRPCGTVAAYQRHLRRGEEPCEECTAAAAAYGRPRTRARRRAEVRLARAHPVQFARLLAEENAKEFAEDGAP